MTLATLFFHRKLGVIAGLCFVGVAFTPGISTSPLTIISSCGHSAPSSKQSLIYGIAILGERALPKPFAFTFLAFAILLAAYVLLLTFGPSPKAARGLRIQVARQKIIVYASVLTVLNPILGR
jgi:hypothetical protein